MRQFKGLILTGAIAMLCSTASAQVTVVIDNQIIPTDHIESITILKNTNTVSIATTVPYTVAPTVIGTYATISSFTISPSSIETGESATLSWTSANTDTCTASGGVASWTGTVATSGSQSVTPASAGSYTFTLTCSGPVGADDVRNVNLNVTLANAVAINSFAASPTSIFEGENTTLSWSAANANECTPTGGTAAWRATSIGLPSGSVQVAIDAAGSYTFGLSCSGDVGDPVSASATVSVSVPNSCGSAALDGSTVEWADFWGTAFPGPTYQNQDTMIPKSGYRAIHFNTANIVSNGRIKMIENTLSPVVILGAISECPGDFDVPGVCDYVWGLGGEIIWSTNDAFRTCQLDPNKDYYLNITFTDGVNPATTSCGATLCKATVQHKNY